MSKSNILPFNYNGVQLVVQQDENGDPLFEVNSLCDLLQYSNARDALSRHVSKDDVVKRDTIDNMGRVQKKNHVKERGMWKLLMKSNAPNAEPVQDWIAGEVLPSIRKTGGYTATCHTGNYRQCYGEHRRWSKTTFIFDTALILGTITTSLKQQ